MAILLARRRLPIWVLVLGLLSIGCILLKYRYSRVETSAGSATSDVLARLATENAERMDRVRNELERATVSLAAAESPSAQTRQGARGHSGKTIAAFERSAHVLHQARRAFNRDELQKKEYERIVQDPATVALVRDVVSDPAVGQDIFGKEQAIMRLYAVRTVVHLADHGHPEYAAEAVDTLGRKLNANTQWEKGVEYDYVEMLTSYVRSIGLKGILENPDELWDKCHLSSRTSTEVGRALSDSGLFRALSAEERAKLTATHDRHLKEEK